MKKIALTISIILNIWLLGILIYMWNIKAYAFNYYGQEYSFKLGTYFIEYLRGE